MQNIFYELIKEAATGKVIIDKEEWPIGFNTTILKDENEITYNGKTNLSTLIIKNENQNLNNEILNDIVKAIKEDEMDLKK